MKNKKIITVFVLAVIVVGGLSFYAGSKHAESASRTQRGSTSNQFGMSGRGSGSRMGGNFAGGTIIAKDATSITVQGRDGSSKIVAGDDSDIIIGKEVTITGKTNSDGSVTAQSIQIRPAMTSTENKATTSSYN